MKLHTRSVWTFTCIEIICPLRNIFLFINENRHILRWDQTSKGLIIIFRYVAFAAYSGLGLGFGSLYVPKKTFSSRSWLHQEVELITLHRCSVLCISCLLLNRGAFLRGSKHVWMPGFLSFAERCLEIMAIFDRSLNVQVQHSSETNFLEFGKNFQQLKQFGCTNSEHSGETAQMRILTWAFAVSIWYGSAPQVLFLCLKYMSAHKFFWQKYFALMMFSWFWRTWMFCVERRRCTYVHHQFRCP